MQHLSAMWWYHQGVVLTPVWERVAEVFTWVWVIRTNGAEQVFLPLVVNLAEQLTLFQDKLVALSELPITHTAAEAVQVVDALQSSHHELRRGDLLHAAAAFGRK